MAEADAANRENGLSTGTDLLLSILEAVPLQSCEGNGGRWVMVSSDINSIDYRSAPRAIEFVLMTPGLSVKVRQSRKVGGHL